MVGVGKTTTCDRERETIEVSGARERTREVAIGAN